MTSMPEGVVWSVSAECPLPHVTLCPCHTKKPPATAGGLTEGYWLPDVDSNHDWLIQSQLSYH